MYCQFSYYIILTVTVYKKLVHLTIKKDVALLRLFLHAQ